MAGLAAGTPSGTAGERHSVQTAFLELFATATRTGIVPADSLERVDRGLGGGGRCEPEPAGAGGAPFLIPLERVREGIPAGQFSDRILEWRDPTVLEACQALRIGERSRQIPAEVVVSHDP